MERKCRYRGESISRRIFTPNVNGGVMRQRRCQRVVQSYVSCTRLLWFINVDGRWLRFKWPVKCPKEIKPFNQQQFGKPAADSPCVLASTGLLAVGT